VRKTGVQRGQGARLLEVPVLMGLDDTSVQGFLATKEVAVLATLQADGSPLAMPMWFLHAPATLTMISVAETQKVRNLRRDPRVSRGGGGGHGAVARYAG